MNCLPKSFAMVLDLPYDLIIKFCGHDGSAKWWPELGEPECRRGFHIQEMIDLAFSHGYSVTPFEAMPTCKGNVNAIARVVSMIDPPEVRMSEYMSKMNGVITGETMSGKGHAVAWINKKLIDPANRIIMPDQMVIQTFWAVCKIKSK